MAILCVLVIYEKFVALGPWVLDVFERPLYNFNPNYHVMVGETNWNYVINLNLFT